MAKKNTSKISKIFGGGKSKTKVSEKVGKHTRRVESALNKVNKASYQSKREYEKAFASLQKEIEKAQSVIDGGTLSASDKEAFTKLQNVNQALIIAMQQDKISQAAMTELLDDRKDFYKDIEKLAANNEELQNYIEENDEVTGSLSDSLENLVTLEQEKATLAFEKKNEKAAKKAQFLKDAGVFTALAAPLLGVLGPVGKDLGELLRLDEKFYKFAFKRFGGKDEEDAPTTASVEAIQNPTIDPSLKAKLDSEKREKENKEDEAQDAQEDWQRENIRLGRERERAEKENKGGIFSKLKNMFSNFFGKGSLLGRLAGSFGKLGWIGKMLPFLGKLGLVGTAGFLGYKFGQWLDKELGLSEKIAEFFSPNKDYDPNATNLSERERGLLADHKAGKKAAYSFNKTFAGFGSASELAIAMRKKSQEQTMGNGLGMNYAIENAANKYGLDAGLMTAIAGATSGFNAQAIGMEGNAQNKTGRGLFLITDSDWKELFNPKNKERVERLKKYGLTGKPDERFDPMKNAIAAAELMTMYKQNASNAGLGFDGATAFAQSILGKQGLELFNKGNINKTAAEVFGKDAVKNNPALFYEGYDKDKSGNAIFDAQGNLTGKNLRAKSVKEVQDYVNTMAEPAKDLSKIIGSGTSSAEQIKAKTMQQLEMESRGAKVEGGEVKPTLDKNAPSFVAGGANYSINDVPFIVDDASLMLMVTGAVA